MSTTTPLEKTAAGAADFFDTRVGAAKTVKEFARKVFPDHWSFLLGEIALYSFVVLLLTGTFLTMFFVPSMTEVHYPDDALPVAMRGIEMSEAFASTLNMSFHVRGGLLMRQIHHWAALLFMASIVTHMMRVFFTGAFRKPRELNWVVGFTLMILGLAAGFTGYSLPDDVLSGNGLRITDGVVKSIPVIGSYMSYMIFGGEFPGTEIIPRLFTAHILLVPALILALIAVHLVLIVVHKHTQYPGPGRNNRNVVGYPLFPVYVAKAGGFFFVVFGVLAIMGATLAINSVWAYGPYDPSPVGAGAQPDWYMLFLEGSLRLMPGQPEFVIAGYTLSLNVLIPAVVIPGLLFTALAVYPFIEARATGDKREHHVLDRPRNVPTRTGVGVAILTAFMILVLAGSNDIIATHFDLSINAITWVFRFLFFAGPVLGFIIAKRMCLALQRRDRELVLHGHETGRVVRFASGEYIEVHQPLTETERYLLVSHEPTRPLEIGPTENSRGVARPDLKKARRTAKLSSFFFADRVEPVTPSELEAAHGHAEHTAIEPAQENEAVLTNASTRG
ncbi:ubiquinol-cytochrome c reductase cytochrome b subunit [Serinibacter arcticus]|uniref:Cytochrome bc1 complex cytochrome b subunit n=1 Tax=Serinibacter arcticus TaxID=1655435 RepID=A0A2U1ZS89_9MICO|nr:ubiquinol-cytochrome c reductase cytochrome b subunit [Serinibacter arcticus]PWD49855.1 ubiquinol-cytochrome c reductase cytochrome b subunit [Serinibacter arcticus]